MCTTYRNYTICRNLLIRKKRNKSVCQQVLYESIRKYKYSKKERKKQTKKLRAKKSEKTKIKQREERKKQR